MPADTLPPPADAAGAKKLKDFPTGPAPDLAELAAASPMRVDGVAIPDDVREAGTVLFEDLGAFVNWLRAGRPHFDDRTPLSLIAEGEADRVTALLTQLLWGVLP